MGESLKGFISVELFFLKMWLTMPKIHGKKWSNSHDHHHWITLILNHFSNSFGIFFFWNQGDIVSKTSYQEDLLYPQETKNYN